MSDRKHEPLPEDHKPVPGKKDTKRWCGGHHGREHRWAWTRHLTAGAYNDWALTCQSCGKVLQKCLDFPWARKSACACGHHTR